MNSGNLLLTYKKLPNGSQTASFERINEYALVYYWKGSDSAKRPIGLTSHYDVVPVLAGTESNWEEDPFSGKVVNGKIWGRGRLDDKLELLKNKNTNFQTISLWLAWINRA
jgi:carboxypeptidase PM20D1